MADKASESSTEAILRTLPEGSLLKELMRPRNAVHVEVRASFELDDAKIFDLNGKGLTVTCVTSN